MVESIKTNVAMKTVTVDRSQWPLAVFDLDDTLNRLANVVFVAMARRGFRVPVSSRRKYHWGDVFGPAAPSMATVTITERLFENAAPNPAVVRAACALRDAGWRLEVWTARAWHPAATRVTREWLDGHGLAGVPFRLTTIGQSKADLVAIAGLPSFYIDDDQAHVEELQAAGCPHAFVYARPWNMGAANRLHDSGLPKVMRATLVESV